MCIDDPATLKMFLAFIDEVIDDQNVNIEDNSIALSIFVITPKLY